ncbi:MAG TPA: class I SAM-dependent methyltransferase, partial [Candidatus Methylomirabilis sp.]|nr:class I SAM-dependent methyltransferase [Candidatus Methylomirabilis sp.]
YTKSYEFYRRISNIEALFRRAVHGRDGCRVLDVGCGDGYHVCLFNADPETQERLTFTAIDMSRIDLGLASALESSLGYENINLVCCSAEHLAFPALYFDVVLCSDVIEHLPRPELCLAEMLRVLKPGGTTILTTPNEDSLVKALAHRLRSKRSASFDERQVHISSKGLRQWQRLATETGFRVTAIRRGALIFGGPKVNRYPILFALVLLLDRILDILPFTGNWAEAITLNLVKPEAPEDSGASIP